MDTNKLALDQLTVAQIENLLQDDELPIQTVNELEHDTRLTVANLLSRWRKRQNNLRAEKKRLYDLYKYERQLKENGYQPVAGVDEAGRGPLAGPLVVAAVILPVNCEIISLNDSKQLSAGERDRIYKEIINSALAIQRCIISVEQIDKINIYQATVQGMMEVLTNLPLTPRAALIDAVKLPKLAIRSLSLVHGDALSASIAAASIVAKVERDQIMTELDKKYPLYGFKRHKGYGTAEHMRAIEKYGPCPVHRLSFEPVKSGRYVNSECK